MKTIQQFLLVILLALLPGSVAMAQEKEGQATATGPTTVYQAKFPLTVQGAEYDLLTLVMDFPAGAGVPKHFHGGHVLVTVLSGEMTLRERGTERVIKPGESWTENPGDEHAVVNAGAGAARIVISVLLPRGAEATTKVK